MSFPSVSFLLSTLPVGGRGANGSAAICHGRIGAHAACGSVSPRLIGTHASGLTLLELLVVLVLASLLGVLVVQGTGFFLGRYETASRIGRSSSRAVLQQRWFVSTVRGMVPSLRDDRRFEGEGGAFEGLTLRPLAAQSGRPTRVRWFIDTGSSEGSSVAYAEEGGVEWTVLTLPESDVSFQYADSAGGWHDRWTTDPRSERGIPSAVRLVSGLERTAWVARPALFPRPVMGPDGEFS